jgi:hypothetical protein
MATHSPARFTTLFNSLKIQQMLAMVFPQMTHP